MNQDFLEQLADVEVPEPPAEFEPPDGQDWVLLLTARPR